MNREDLDQTAHCESDLDLLFSLYHSGFKDSMMWIGKTLV